MHKKTKKKEKEKEKKKGCVTRVTSRHAATSPIYVVLRGRSIYLHGTNRTVHLVTWY